MADFRRGIPVRERIRLNRLRKAMAQAMKTSVERAALSQVYRDIDVTAAQQQRHAAGFSLNSLIMAAVAQNLLRHPLLNAELHEREIITFDTVNLGMAVAVPDGLLVVVIPGAEKMSLPVLDAAIADKAVRARQGTLSMADVEGGTFTVSNLGMFGIEGGFPLPKPPEAAILLVGTARRRPEVIDNEIQIRDMTSFTLNYDHRFIDGAAAARFLQDLAAWFAEIHLLPDTTGESR